MESRYKRVFAAIDGGDTQQIVAEAAVRMAAENHASLCLGHVVDALVAEASSQDMSKLTAGVQERIEHDLAELLDEARKDEAIPSVELRVMAGSVTETLGNVIIPDFDPDLVVCCKRGLSGIRYAFVGSVSTYLIRNMDCDVLVVGKR